MIDFVPKEVFHQAFCVPPNIEKVPFQWSFEPITPLSCVKVDDEQAKLIDDEQDK